jgi:nucleoside-diphosphate-sugar epimerase
MKILISGGSGFVGKNLSGPLQKKEVTIVNVSRNGTENSTISWEQFFKEQSALNYDVFIHLAGKAHDTRNTSDAGEYFEVNTELTKRFFDAFLKSKATIFIHMSTVKAAADTVHEILTEDVLPDPKTPYGQSKLKAEEYLSGNMRPEGKRLFILRPCMMHGPGNKGNLNLLYKFVTRRIPYPFAAFDNKRSFLSIDNLSYVIEQIIDNDAIPGGVYNVADDSPLSTNEVVKIIAGASGIKGRLWKISPRLIKAVASIGDRLHLPLNSERLKKLTESYVVSNDKIKKALQISSLPVSSVSGLEKTVRSFRSS